MVARRILLETSSLSQPGSDRGLGRYTRALRSAYLEDSSVELSEIKSGSNLKKFREIQANKTDASAIYHSTSAYGLPIVKNIPWLCSIQDIIPLDLDEYSRFGLKARLAFVNARRANFIVANSNYTAERVADRLQYPSNRILRLSLPVDAKFSDQKYVEYSEREPYFAALADLRIGDPRKRAHWLGPIAAGLSDLGVQLRVAGRGLENLTKVAPYAVAVDTPQDSDLAEFYARSLAFVYTTSYEGQGLPPLEAMACGTPVIAFSNTSVIEMVGPGQVLLQDPIPWEQQKLKAPIPGESVDELVSHADILLSDQANWTRASENSLNQSAKFSQAEFSRQLRYIVRRATE